jgi:hypothetical protein
MLWVCVSEMQTYTLVEIKQPRERALSRALAPENPSVRLGKRKRAQRDRVTRR